MVKQIGFYADETDEAEFVDAAAAEGALFLPSVYPQWPLPVLRPPLPARTEPYMGAVVIWHPAIFREDELMREDNRVHNPAGGFYDASLWPVLELERPHLINRPAYWGGLRFDASYRSFCLYRPLPQFSPAEVRDFTERVNELERFYRRLCSWVRRRFSRVGRGMYCGPSLRPRLSELETG